MTEKEKNLVLFAERTLAILEQQKEWSSDTPADISDVAFNLGLAGTNEDGEFVRI